MEAARADTARAGSAPATARHVLVLPSEEYLPEREPLAGIFQRHQIDAMARVDRYRFGVVSVRLQHSLPMYLKTLAAKTIGRRIDNGLGDRSMGALARGGYRRLVAPGRFVEVEEHRSYPVVRATGLYLAPPSRSLDHHWWIRIGWAAYEAYRARFGRPDLIHAHNAVNAGLLAEMIARRTGLPYIITEHSSYFHQGLYPDRVLRRVAPAMRDAAAVLAVSSALRRTLVGALAGHGPDVPPIEVLPNVVPEVFEEMAIAVTPQFGQPFTFLCVANHLPIKGLDVLLGAFAKLADRTCRLRLVGDGPLRADLERLAQELGIADRVSFLGVRDPAGVCAEMQSSHALVLSSRYETFGVVVIEALCCGLPVVATRCGGPEDVLSEATGIMAKPDDARSLAEAMARMIAERKRFDGKAIRNSVLSRFGRAAFAERLARTYDAALASVQVRE